VKKKKNNGAKEKSWSTHRILPNDIRELKKKELLGRGKKKKGKRKNEMETWGRDKTRGQ